MKSLCIAIDGPAGSGKSTIAKKIAKLLGWTYLDTGAMYRAVTLKMMQKNIETKDEHGILSMLDNIQIDFVGERIIMDGIDVTSEIRSSEVEKEVSEVSSIAEIRHKLVDMQRKYVNFNPVVMDGRDIGTVVLPNAKYKFFLTASVDERARRRHEQLQGKGVDLPISKIKQEIIRRDHLDSTRKISPLKMAEDAHLIDTDGLTIEEVISAVLSLVDESGSSSRRISK